MSSRLWKSSSSNCLLNWRCSWDQDPVLDANFIKVNVGLIPAAHLHSATCPLTGSFFLSPGTADCKAQPTLAAGCDNNNNIVVKQPCEGTTTGTATLSPCHSLSFLSQFIISWRIINSDFDISEFSCHDSWQEERGDSKTRYTIVSYKSNISTR